MNLLIKQQLDPKQLAILHSEVEKRKKSKVFAYVLWWFVGIIGGHRFYLGDIGKGIGMLFTLGGFGIWYLIDLFFIGNRYTEVTTNLEMEIIEQMGFNISK